MTFILRYLYQVPNCFLLFAKLFHMFFINRWQKGKTLLLASISAWILFTLPIGFIQPPATSCLVANHTHYFLETPKVSTVMKREAVWQPIEPSNHLAPVIEHPKVTDPHPRTRRSIRTFLSPMNIDFVANYDKKEQSSWVTPHFSSIVYRTQVILMTLL